jgi:hypothetical protein
MPHTYRLYTPGHPEGIVYKDVVYHTEDGVIAIRDGYDAELIAVFSPSGWTHIERV